MSNFLLQRETNLMNFTLLLQIRMNVKLALIIADLGMNVTTLKGHLGAILVAVQKDQDSLPHLGNVRESIVLED